MGEFFVSCLILSLFDSVSDGRTIRVNGSAGTNVYQDLLRSLQYINPVTEPTPGIRTITINVNDGIFVSANLSVMLSVVLRSDNNVTLMCNSSMLLSFREDGPALNILPEAVVQDRDQDHIIQEAIIQLQNVIDGSSEVLGTNAGALPSGLSMAVSGNRQQLTVTGAAMDSQYQVKSLA